MRFYKLKNSFWLVDYTDLQHIFACFRMVKNTIFSGVSIIRLLKR